MPRDLPSGTVTFLFTDIEGSTRLLHELGPVSYADALAEHRRILRDAFIAHGGVEVDTQGDAFFVAFPTAPGALAAARQAVDGLSSGPIRVRMGLHTGTPHVAAEGYVGTDVHRAARIAAAGQGGQVLISAATASLVDSDGLRDLGEHRLKDLSAPERIYQLGDSDFAPLKSLYQTNLPVPTTPFLGREQEVSEVSALLARDDVRLVTLTGPGGTGKTRLALQSAGAAAEAFAGGVWWVPLATLRDPALVISAAALALGATGDVSEHIGGKALLLLFDNFEHIIDAAGDVATLLDSCPNLKVVATSREPLRITGEWEYAVDPLRDAEAVELFQVRARAARRDFEANGEVPQICRRLDNLPLAIELAAARVKLMSTRALLERLEQRLPVLAGGTRDAPERQRTLRATIEWSHDLLTSEEQRLFARLGVFRGGCTLDTAGAVADADLDTLQSLVDKSLVRQRDDRFWMLETIREYAVEQLEASGEADEMRRQHTERFLGLAEEGGPRVAAHPREWVDRLEREHDNFRAAMDRLEAGSDGQRLLRFVGAMAPFWYLRGHVVEGRRRVEAALAIDPSPSAARATALNAAAMMAFAAGDAGGAKLRATEALPLHRSYANAWGMTYSEHLLGNFAADQRDWANARHIFEGVVQRWRELGDDHYQMVATRALAWMCDELGERERYVALTQENLERARRLGNERMEARALGALALDATYEGRPGEAIPMLKRALGIDRELGERYYIAIDLVRFALAVSGPDPELAARLLARADSLLEEMGSRYESWSAEMKDAALAKIRSHLDEAAFAHASEEGRSLAVHDALASAIDFPE